MKIKSDENLIYLSNLAGKQPEEISSAIIKWLFSQGVIEDDTDCCNCALDECIPGTMPVCQIVDFLDSLSISGEGFNSFLKCTIMGDGDCPECGGEMEIVDTVGYEIPSSDYDLPPDYIAEYDILRCPICGCETKQYR